MPRELLKRIVPAPHSLQDRWFVRLFGDRISDPQLWTLHRRGVTAAFGLGLAICQAIVRAHGGEIEAQRREGGGARFTFTLPASESAA